MGRIEEVLSKCYLWRMDLLIYVSVGTSVFKFNRLFVLMDELCEEKVLDSNDIISQIGFSTYYPKKNYFFDFVEDEKNKEYINKADFLICHAGVGTILSALKQKKKVIVFPRLKKYGEHIDDHQLEISRAFADEGYILLATTKDELSNNIIKIQKFKPNSFSSNKREFNNLVIKYIESGV